MDLKRQKIFWCDSILNSLYSADYEGHNRQALLKDETTKWLSKPIGVAFFEGRLYWLDQTFNEGSVSSVSTVIDGGPELLAQELGHEVHDIKIFSSKNQQGTHLTVINLVKMIR